MLNYFPVMKGLKEELELLKTMLKNATDELTIERNLLSESKTKNEVREKELLFMIQSLEDQLLFQKQRSNVDMSLVDVAIKSEFEKRLNFLSEN